MRNDSVKIKCRQVRYLEMQEKLITNRYNISINTTHIFKYTGINAKYSHTFSYLMLFNQKVHVLLNRRFMRLGYFRYISRAIHCNVITDNREINK